MASSNEDKVRWKCCNCGLSNNHKNTECQACFTPNSSKKEIYEDMIDYHDDNDDDVLIPKCICGQVLVLKPAEDCYDDYKEVYCNICASVTNGKNKVFHCEKIQKHIHYEGYDLCKICAVKTKNGFATNLLTKTKEYEMKNNNKLTNIILSPFSISTALSLAMLGASNNTLKQMIKVLLPNNTDYKLTFEYISKIATNYINICKEYDNKYDGLISIANRLWIRNGFKVKQKYMDICNINVEYLDCNNLEVAARNINKWCAQKTNNLIEEIVKSSDLAFVRIIITNAIYFTGQFEMAFPVKNTRKNVNFYLTAKRKQLNGKVCMMHSTLFHWFAKDINNGQYDAVKLFYKNCNKDLSLILIKNNAVNQNRTDFRIDDIKNIKFKKNKLKLYAPKFEFQCDFNLNDILISMGMVDGFKENLANFSNITDETIWIDKVLHKAYIKIDEKGTKAAAVTAVVMRGRGRAKSTQQTIPVIRFDHIFNFYIMDEGKMIVLFSGTFVGQT